MCIIIGFLNANKQKYAEIFYMSACNRSKGKKSVNKPRTENTRLMFYLLANDTEYAGTVVSLQVHTYSGSAAKQYFQHRASHHGVLLQTPSSR